MKVQLSYARRHGVIYADVNTTIKRPPSRRPLCRCKPNYQTPAVTTASVQMQRHVLYASCKDGIYTDVSTPIIRSRSTTASMQISTQQSNSCRLDGLYADVNTTIKRTLSRRFLYRCKHNYHTITVKDSLYDNSNTAIIQPSSRRPLF